MSTSSTRAATASAASRAQKELIRLLYGNNNKINNTATPSTATIASNNTNNNNDNNKINYSHSKLRRDYLQKIQELHPDKHQTTKSTIQKEEFQQLLQAWERYNEIAKEHGSVISGDNNDTSVNSNFTMFGVGCSFSDNPQERALREEITDQACRGWFSSGAIDAISTTKISNNNNTSNIVSNQKSPTKTASSLIDEDMFIPNEPMPMADSNSSPQNKPSLVSRPPKHRK